MRDRPSLRAITRTTTRRKDPTQTRLVLTRRTTVARQMSTSRTAAARPTANRARDWAPAANTRRRASQIFVSTRKYLAQKYLHRPRERGANFRARAERAIGPCAGAVLRRPIRVLPTRFRAIQWWRRGGTATVGTKRRTRTREARPASSSPGEWQRWETKHTQTNMKHIGKHYDLPQHFFQKSKDSIHVQHA